MNQEPIDYGSVAARMRGERRAAIGVHVQPDADAAGAAAGLLDLFDQLGVPADVYINADEQLPLPELLLPPARVKRGLPPADSTLYALDCGAKARIALPIDDWHGAIVNIDHHGDNPGFGDLALIAPRASSTSEMVCELGDALGLTPSVAAARALYAGISFDTGHFRHSSTSPSTFTWAARLQSLGVDVTEVYRQMYEQRSFGALCLLACGVARVERLAAGRGLVAALSRDDFTACDADEADAGGIVEALRSCVNVEVAALVREDTAAARVKVSLRSHGLDVQAVAALRSGGGHTMAAGFSSDESLQEVTTWLCCELEKRLSTASS